MERVQRDLRPVPSERTGPDGSVHPLDGSEQELWHALETAADAPTVLSAWLSLVCRRIDGCRHGVVLLGAADRGPFSPVASWPEGAPTSRPLLAAAERALPKREPAVVAPASSGVGALTTVGSILADPILLRGALHGAVVLEVSPRSDAAMLAIRDQLHLGFGWLDALVHRGHAAGEQLGKERLEVVLGLL